MRNTHRSALTSRSRVSIKRPILRMRNESVPLIADESHSGWLILAHPRLGSVLYELVKGSRTPVRRWAYSGPQGRQESFPTGLPEALERAVVGAWISSQDAELQG